MQKKQPYFGTDGMRGRVNAGLITPQTVLSLAMAASAHFRRGDHKNRVVIGKDTRQSGYMLENTLTAGFLAMGMDVLLLGPVPTPAVAMLTRSMRAELGVMISASHNPFFDNGIKLFGPDGYKLSDQDEIDIAALMDQQNWQLPQSEEVGRAKRIDDAAGRYIEYVKSSFPAHLRLDGMRLVVDCAHGSAYKIAPIVLRELGADVVTLGVAPDGTNINHEVGATHPQAMADIVKQQGADIGISLDGDADRVIICDELGQLVDGDQILALIGTAWKAQDRLNNGVVTTILSNLGLERYFETQGIPFYRTPVGDRHVVAKMREINANLGGEPSGHIVLDGHATTGDGLIAALQVLASLQEQNQPMSIISKCFEPVPQITRNVKIAPDHDTKHKVDTDNDLKTCIEACEAELGEEGRLVVRPSGTEPLIRIMIEGENKPAMNKMADRLEQTILAF